jgi:[ribosomal protein S5]-alanine N-acetyltransferase
MLTTSETHTDSGELAAARVFTELCRMTLDDRTIPSATAARRLWNLPEAATYFVFGAVTKAERQKVDSIVHDLRGRAGKIINEQLDCAGAKQAIAASLASARRDFTLRSWRPSDASLLASFLSSIKLWEGLPDERPADVTEHLADELIAISNGWSERHVVSAVECRGQTIGQVRLQFDSSPFADTSEISYWIGEKFWGNGHATKAVTLFTAECFNRRPQLQGIFAQVLDGNQASIRVLEKAGYRYESFRHGNVTKGGCRRSTHVLSVCRADYESLPEIARPAGFAVTNALLSLLSLSPELGEQLLAWQPVLAFA